MAQAENSTFKLNSTTNVTDPKVVFDPKFEHTTIALSWAPDNKNEEGADDTVNRNEGFENTRIDGIDYPLIQVNKHIISKADILYFVLDYTNTFPQLTLIINKRDYLTTDTPGLVNKITVILVPPVNGTYRKISLDFYISKMTDYGDSVGFNGSFFLPILNKRFLKSISNGSTNKLTTYELFETIAKETKLGFAATEDCKSINDARPRLFINQNVCELLNQHIEFGGLDEKSYFTYWIDVYGNLVLCNLSWVFSNLVSINDLSIKNLTGVNITDSNTASENTINYTEDTFRCFSNNRITTAKETNIINEYTVEVNNRDILKFGTNNNFYFVDPAANPESSSGQMLNMVKTVKTTIQENSQDGKTYKDAYNVEKNNYVGVEFGFKTDGCSPILSQKHNRAAFLLQHTNKQLKVKLAEPHLGLERGTLISIVINEYSTDGKRNLIANMGNIAASDADNATNLELGTLDSAAEENLINNTNIGIPNLSLSGIYFINGIKFEFEEGHVLNQYLYLIRQTAEVSYYNYSTLLKGLAATAN